MSQDEINSFILVKKKNQGNSILNNHLKREFQFHIQICDNDNRLTSAVILYFSFIEASNRLYEARLKRPVVAPTMAPENSHRTNAKPAPHRH